MTPARGQRLAAALAAALAGGFVYRATLDHGFVWDDHIHIESAPFVQNPANARVLLSAGFWTGRVPVEGSARPLLLASLLADRALWGDAARGYHLTNVLLHAASAAAFTALAAAWTASAAAAALAGALFALHPVQSEAVCAVSFRADLIAALLTLLALAARRRARSEATRAWAWNAAAAACVGLGLLGKESAAAAPALLALEEALFARGQAASWAGVASQARLASRTGLLIFLAATLGAYAAFRLPRGGYSLITAAAPYGSVTLPRLMARSQPVLQPSRHSDPSSREDADALRDPATRLRTMAGVFCDYARLTLWPARLQADRSAPVERDWSSPRVWAGLAAMAALLAAVWGLRRRSPCAAFGLAWYAAALAPVSGLVLLFNLIAERYLYLPLAGAALAAAAAITAIARAARQPALVYTAAAAVLLPAAYHTTLARVPAWRDDASLFGGPIVTENSRLRYNRGLIAHMQGNRRDAEAEYRRALELNPRYVEAMVNLADLMRAEGRSAEELELLLRSIAVAPRSAAHPMGSAVAQTALGDALERRGREAEALDAYQRAVNIDGRSLSARRRLAAALESTGRWAEAFAEARRSDALTPGAGEALYAAGSSAQDQIRLDDAVDAFREAVRQAPTHGLAWANLGVALHQSGRAREALPAMERARALLPKRADIRSNLGALYDDLGAAEAAEAEFAAATRLSPSWANAWHGYGVVLSKRGKTREAAGAYAHALEVEPNKVESLVNLAGLRLNAGESDHALVLLERALAARPDDTTVRRALAVARAAAR